jgi:hypothetical protein
MKTFLNFHASAAVRGEGLRPELRLLFERTAASPFSDLVRRGDGMLQSGPDPASQDVPERANVSRFPPASAGRIAGPNPKPEVLARLFRKRTT